MKIKDLWLWRFDKDPYEGCSIICPECKETSPHAEWSESEVGCELCGEHTAIKCPKCDERFDHVDSETFQII